MKKNDYGKAKLSFRLLLSFVILLVLPSLLLAQTVTLKFTGCDMNSRYVRLNRVAVTNLTRGWQETIYWPDTTLVMNNGVGIEENVNATDFELFQNFPNPFNNTTGVTLSVKEPGTVTLELANIYGKSIFSLPCNISQQGLHQFRILIAQSGTYVLTARQNGKTSSIKMINNGGGNENCIVYDGLCPITKSDTRGRTTNPFLFGDVMEYVGYAIINGTEIESTRITQMQGASQTFTLRFEVDGTSTPGVIAGALPGLFSISASQQIHFSKGNLQYQASTGTWRFAENQWDRIGADNRNISSTNSGWIDLFGWGTSGYNDKYPWMTSTTETDYGDNQNNIAYTNYDWGQYNPISNGGNQAGLWRTLSSQEMSYMIGSRPNAGNLYAMGVVNDRHGLIILPDDFILPNGIEFTPAYKEFTNDVNNFSSAQWQLLENEGAVFLPVTGVRRGTSVSEEEESGYYWSTDILSPNDGAREMWFGRMYIYYNPGIGGSFGRVNGISVRLVTD